jgi:hypothetical protein
MKRALIFSASFVLAAWAAPAGAQNSILTGKYGVTGTTICNISTGAVSIITTEDIHTFYGDGTGAVALTSLVSTAGAIGSANISKSTYTFKYAVNRDRTFTLTVDSGSFSGAIVSGPNTGLGFSYDQLAPMRGFIGIYATTLTGTTSESLLETVTFSNGNVHTQKCQRTQVFTKVGEE